MLLALPGAGGGGEEDGTKHLEPSTKCLLPPVHVGTQLCVPVHRLMETAREMTRESLPIKCLEAVILAMYPDRGGGGSGGGNLLGLPVTRGTL